MAKAKVWNGSAWIMSDLGSPIVWNGSSWLYPTMKIWDGVGWVTEVGFALDSVANVQSYDTFFASIASVEVQSGGGFIGNGNVDGFSSSWIKSTSTNGAGYEVRATVVGGALSGGTTGSWLALTSSQTWFVTASSFEPSVGATIDLDLRQTGGSIISTKRVFLSATLDEMGGEPGFPQF